MAKVPGHKRSGVISESELKRRGVLPSMKRLKQGPCVIVECVENIPCNPCAYACPRKAITIDGELTDVPEVDFEKCNGCTLCIARCPGLAIFVVDYDHSKTHATVTIPYELLPRLEKGQRVAALDRDGKRVCTGVVTRVLDTKKMDRCAAITVRVPKDCWNNVRQIKASRKRG